MKTKIFLSLLVVLAITDVKAQNLYNAAPVLGNELNGTARFVGMGGAMSALGGDISVMGTNPAGIGIYRSSDMALSFGMNNTKTKSDFEGMTFNEKKNIGSFDQIGFVYSNKIGDYTSLKYVNFGFNYHKDKNFNRRFTSGGFLNGFSQTKQMAFAMNRIGVTDKKFDDILDAKNPFDSYYGTFPLLPMMGAIPDLIDWDDNANGIVGWDGNDNSFFSRESGGINSYDFNVAFNLEDQFYLGATLGVQDLDYNLYTSYSESLNYDNGDDNGGYVLDNHYKLSGTGVNLKLGMIIRPFVDSPFRFGASVSTPTWYDVRESFNAILDADVKEFKPYTINLADNLYDDDLNYDYNIITPWKFNLSMATTIENVLALDAEYEYEDYSSTKLEDVDGNDLGDSGSLKMMKGVSTFKVGMEAKLSPQFSLRAGYNYTTAAFKDGAYSALSDYSTQTAYNNTKDRKTFTCGLGYRGSVIYADLAYKYDFYKSDFYAFDDENLSATKVDNSRNQLIFTLGARF